MPSRSITLLDANGVVNAPVGSPAINAVTTPAVASTPKIMGTVTNLSRWQQIIIRLTATAALGGGPCDYVLQRLVDGPNGSTWDDFIYLGQQAAGVAVDFIGYLSNDADIVNYAADKGDVGWPRHDVNADATLALAQGERRPGACGPSLRLIARTGALVNAAATVSMWVQASEKD